MASPFRTRAEMIAEANAERDDARMRAQTALKFLRERDEAVALLKRWQYNDTTAPGPVDETADYLHRVAYKPQRAPRA